MLQVPRIEKLMGIEVYATSSVGIGGVIRESVDDFLVEEVLVDGSRARIKAIVDQTDRKALGCSSNENHYLLCVMVKRNWDTLIAVKSVADDLGIDPRHIQIAGIKDARAVTAQYVTIEGVAPEKVQRIRLKDIEIRPLGYVTNEMSAYYLLGNSFGIRIKAIEHSTSTIKKRTAKTVDELEKTGGIPNFFGHQRFGTTRPITHRVGKEMVKGNFERAVMLFLARPGRYEHPSSSQARKELQSTRNFIRALKDFPKQLRYERFMLRHLAKHTDDFVGAFRTLPVKLRQLFIQAYQSYLFNKSLSRRIASGLPLDKAETGDYVVNLERSGLPMLSMHRTAYPAVLTEINKSIKNGRMRLAIPLLGFRQSCSQGIQGEIEKKILEKERIRPDQFKIVTMPEISARGELRTATASLLEFKMVETSNEPVRSSSHVELSFTLHRGSYATIVLREIMKPRSIIDAGF
jgi:tRNA pseudouridine13 synthase